MYLFPIYFFRKRDTQFPRLFLHKFFLLFFCQLFTLLFKKQDNFTSRIAAACFPTAFSSKKCVTSIIAVKYSCFTKSKPYVRARVAVFGEIFGNEREGELPEIECA